jgi:Flp pilus assembly protein CpaB
MSLTETRPETAPPPRASSRPRTRLVSRLSGGHWLMLLAGLLATILNVSLLRSVDDSVAVLAVTRDIAPGEGINRADLRSVAVDADANVLGTLVHAEQMTELDGQVSVGSLSRGQLLHRAAVRAPAHDAGLRTMSIPIDPAHAVGGTLQVGDRVDVIALGDASATYLTADAEVVGVADRGTTGLATPGTYHVTLAVDAPTALRLAEAVENGGVRLVGSSGAPPLPASSDPAGEPRPAPQAATR